MPIDESISSILASQLLREEANLHRTSVLSNYHHYEYDTEMNNILRLATAYATRQVFNEYKFAQDVRKSY